MVAQGISSTRRGGVAFVLVPVLILVLTSLNPLFNPGASLDSLSDSTADSTSADSTNAKSADSTGADSSAVDSTGGRSEVVVWNGSEQPWPQQGRDAGRTAMPPLHSVDGGAGNGDPDDAVELGVIASPALNWAYGTDVIDTDSLASVVGDFSDSITAAEGAEQRCGGASLFPVVVQTRDVGGTDHSYLTLIEGEDAESAWEVDLGATDRVKAAPMIADIDADGKPEIIVVFDAQDILTVEVWSPRLSCVATGWSSGGHSAEKWWTYSDETLQIGSDDGPYTAGWAGNHRPTAQPVVADLDLDGVPELAIPAVSNANDQPVIVALPLPESSTPTPIWSAALAKGTHPSDLAWTQLDSESSAVLLTTIDADDGSMWVWRLDGATGSAQWGGSTLNNLDGGTSNAPHIRLPGPIIVQLDSDEAPEMVVTIPTDFDGSGSSDAAEFVAIEVTSGSEIWKARANDGFADAAPVAIDTDADGIDDRICWVTWWQTNTARHGSAGCHDVSGTTPVRDWSRPLEQSSGNPNDEIAVASPVWMNIDENLPPELLVAYGRSLWALDGETGTGSGISSDWANSFTLPHRTWASPALADVDGDGLLDIIIGGMVVSQSISDVRPFLDAGGIEFSPKAPDPDQNVTITAYIENVGTVVTDDDVDLILYAGTEEIGRNRAGLLDPVEPSGSGSFASFSVQWTGGLGTHQFSLQVDPENNVTQSRVDNDLLTRELRIIAPYNLSIGWTEEQVRVDPGSSVVAQPIITSTGRLSGNWDMTVDATALPEGWTWMDETPGGILAVGIGIGQTWVPQLRISAPNGALGTDSGYLLLSLTPSQDPETNITSLISVEANRTRGLSVRGPDSTNVTTGFGIIGGYAAAWLVVENLGNAEETTTAITWENTSWGSNLTLYDSDGNTHPTLTIGPGDSIELTARILVDADASLGDSVGTPLSICIGGGTEQQCENIGLTFTANDVSLLPPHIRSTPTMTLTWALTAHIPAGASELEWDLAAAGMNQPGWVWGADGALTLTQDSLFVHGSAGSTVSGSITLTLPVAAPPGTHHFEAAESNNSGADLSFSLRILQVHRASITLISPTDSVNRFEVGVPFVATLRLENTGNGPDEYTLSADFLSGGNLTFDPGLEISFPSPTVALSAGSLTTIPVTITAPESTPARVSFTMRFRSGSLGTDIYAVADLVLEARQDHRWNLSMVNDGANLEDSGRLFALPGESVVVDVLAENIGNHDDLLGFAVSISLSLVGSDPGDVWSTSTLNISRVDVAANGSGQISVELPTSSWNGSVATVTILAYADGGYSVPGLSFDVEVAHIPAWAVHASGSNLDIDPEGDTVTLQIEQRGNDPVRPAFTTWVTGALDWQVEIASQPDSLEPTEVGLLTLNIMPPATARAGHAVQLHIRVRNPDSTGVSEVTFPVRVAATINHSLNGGSEWLISPAGGMPLAWVSNLGNGPATISLDVLGVPNGWSLDAPDSIHLGTGESIGLPIDVIPINWSGEDVSITIRTTDEAGIQRELLVPLTNSSIAWATSPLLVSVEGDSLGLTLYETTSTSTVRVESGPLLTYQNGNFIWTTKAADDGQGNLIADGVSLTFLAIVHERTTRSASCRLVESVNGSNQGSCTVENGTAIFDYTMLLSDESGQLVGIVEGSIPASETAVINIGHMWNPSPGDRRLILRLIDTHGAIRGSVSQNYVVRDSDWNIGIVAVELEGSSGDQRLSISTQRSNHNKLTSSDCTLTFSADGWNSTHLIDVDGPVAPKFRLGRPPLPDGTEIDVKIACASPWDVDSNPDDDSKRIVLAGQNDLVSGGVDAVSGVVMAAIVLLVMWVLGIIQPRSDRQDADDSVRVGSGSGLRAGATTDADAGAAVSSKSTDDDSMTLGTMSPSSDVSSGDSRAKSYQDGLLNRASDSSDSSGSSLRLDQDAIATTDESDTSDRIDSGEDTDLSTPGDKGESGGTVIDEEEAEFQRLLAATEDDFERRLLLLRYNRKRRGGHT